MAGVLVAPQARCEWGEDARPGGHPGGPASTAAASPRQTATCILGKALGADSDISVLADVMLMAADRAEPARPPLHAEFSALAYC